MRILSGPECIARIGESQFCVVSLYLKLKVNPKLEVVDKIVLIQGESNSTTVVGIAERSNEHL